MKKTQTKKSHATVPLNTAFLKIIIFFLFHFLSRFCFHDKNNGIFTKLNFFAKEGAVGVHFREIYLKICFLKT